MSSVLIVDDEPKIRELLRRWLEPEGYGLREAAHAEQALEALQSGRSDVVLVDVQMPGHDGLWLVTRIRDRFPSTAIVLATAVDTVPPVISLQDGVVAYLVKPFERERVLSAVKEAIAWQQTRGADAARSKEGQDPIETWIKGKLYGGRPPVEDE